MQTLKPRTLAGTLLWLAPLPSLLADRRVGSQLLASAAALPLFAMAGGLATVDGEFDVPAAVPAEAATLCADLGPLEQHRLGWLLVLGVKG
jgi:hypothetical protein